MRAIYLDDGQVHETSSLDELDALVKRSSFVWVDLDSSIPEGNEALERVFGLHPLTVEDIWNEQSSPKIEDFDSYLYVRVHGAHTFNADGSVALAELDLVIGPKFVITHDCHRVCAIDDLRASLMRSPRTFGRGAAWLAHTLLDQLVDRYVTVIEQFEGQIEVLEEDILEKAGAPGGRPVLARIFEMKRSLQAVRRVSVHQREILLRLARGEFDEIPLDALPFYRDVYDHFVRVTDLTDSYRELVTGALEIHLSVQSNRMNGVMKTLTLMSTIMLPLTFIAGVYGMNFEHMPELKWAYGYPFALLVMAAVAIAIMVWFRFKKWV
jgi:magnesium transporter